MKRTLLVFALATAAALAAVTAAHAAVTMNVTQPISWSTSIPCGNGGAGDSITMEGTQHILVTATSNDNVYSSVMRLQFQGAGYSLSTGAKYHASEAIVDAFDTSIVNGQWVFTYVMSFHLIGQGGAENYLQHQTYHMTTNALGVQTAVLDHSSGECR